jgi:hypothetical protein
MHIYMEKLVELSVLHKAQFVNCNNFINFVIIFYHFINLLKQSAKYHCNLSSRDSGVGIATSYGLDDRGVGVRVPVG